MTARVTHRRISRWFAPTLPILALACLSVTPASAAPAARSTCTGGAIAPGTYLGLTVVGSCTIPSGTVVVRGGLVVTRASALWSLSGATLAVSGGVTLQANSSFITSSARVDGAIQADNPTFLLIGSSTLGGAVRVVGGIEIDIRSSTLNGGFSQEQMGSPSNTTVAQSVVRGGISVTNGGIRGGVSLLLNRISGGARIVNIRSRNDMSSTIAGNTIAGNLVCSGNEPAPTNGGVQNTVSGQTIGQCAGF